MRTLLGLLLAGVAGLAFTDIPSPQISVLRNEAVSRFPDSITFSLEASSPNSVTGVELEFGTDAKVCGESTDRISPDEFTPGTTSAADWTWDLRRTGALPPGTTVWWRWIIRDGSGEEVTTPDQSLVIEDTHHPWTERTAGPLHLYWYSGEASFADALLQAGQRALAAIRASTDIDFDGDVRVFIYEDSQAMQSATLFAPGWSGGLAFPQHSAVLIAIAPDELEWGKRAIAHELTHLVVGHHTFSCLESTPAWVDEGLAMYNEGEPDSWSAAILEEAIRQNTLLPVRSLSQGFSNDPDLANLAYAQSQSLVAYLVEQFGPERMVQLLDEFRNGTPEDLALTAVYSFDRGGLEAAWREHIGATASASGVPSGGRPTITPYPTFAPLVAGGNPGAVIPTGTPVSSASNPSAAQPQPAGGPGVCTMPAALTVAGLGIVLFPRRQRRQPPQGRPR
jgi:hypothetical protein